MSNGSLDLYAADLLIREIKYVFEFCILKSILITENFYVKI